MFHIEAKAQIEKSADKAKQRAAKIGVAIIASVWLLLVVPPILIFFIGYAVLVFPLPRIEAHTNTVFAQDFNLEKWEQVDVGMSMGEVAVKLGEPLWRQGDTWIYSGFIEDGGWFRYQLDIGGATNTVLAKSCKVEVQD